jgi:hypothetical protein
VKHARFSQGGVSVLGLRFFVLVSLVLFVVASSLASSSARAEGIRIHVRGSAKIAARASRDQGDLVLSGALTDDAGQPLAGESVTVHVARESDAKDPKVADGLRAVHGCDRVGDRAPVAYGVRAVGPTDSPDIIVVTDESGRFCFRAHLVPDRHRAHLSWRGASAPSSPTALLDAADADLIFDLSRQALVLRFDPTPRVVSLDEPRTTFEATALVDDDGTTHSAPGLALSLANEKGELANATTDGSGRARFAIEAAKLGPPGPGELRVSFRGNTETAFATYAAEIERHVKVSLRVPAAEKGELAAQVPEDGIPIVVDVGSSIGPVTEGGVEARFGDAIVGAAPVERGIARLTLTFTAPGSEALVRLRYVPSAPWFEPLGETSVRVPIRGPGILSKAPILIAGLAVLVFFLIGRVSSRQAKPEPAKPSGQEPAREGKPRLEVVRAAGRGETGWRGTIADAHEGTPVKDARIWIERGSFEGKTILESVGTDAHGAFVLAGRFPITGGEQMSAEAPLHARLVQPLPPPGELSIALVLRRRALLARLVKWARREGKPFDVRPEATPGHVRRAAGDDFQTARWADAVERAVFGEGEVDARAEREIERMAPQGAPTPEKALADDPDDDPPPNAPGRDPG